MIEKKMMTSSASFGTFREADLLPGESLRVTMTLVLAASRRHRRFDVGVRRLHVERRVAAFVLSK